MTNVHDRGPEETPMTDPSLNSSAKRWREQGADFAIEPVVVSGHYPGALADDGGYLAVATVRSEDPDDALHPLTSCGMGKTPDDAMRKPLGPSHRRHDRGGSLVQGAAFFAGVVLALTDKLATWWGIIMVVAFLLAPGYATADANPGASKQPSRGVHALIPS
jgi:choline dehydrogenase-like flavoprotein